MPFNRWSFLDGLFHILLWIDRQPVRGWEWGTSHPTFRWWMDGPSKVTTQHHHHQLYIVKFDLILLIIKGKKRSHGLAFRMGTARDGSRKKQKEKIEFDELKQKEKQSYVVNLSSDSLLAKNTEITEVRMWRLLSTHPGDLLFLRRKISEESIPLLFLT